MEGRVRVKGEKVKQKVAKTSHFESRLYGPEELNGTDILLGQDHQILDLAPN